MKTFRLHYPDVANWVVCQDARGIFSKGEEKFSVVRKLTCVIIRSIFYIRRNKMETNSPMAGINTKIGHYSKNPYFGKKADRYFGSR
jgi:hypothetical protein